MSDPRSRREVLIGNAELLDHLATLNHVNVERGERQEFLEELVAEVLTPEEYEIFLLRFGEQLSFRAIAARLGYLSHQTFQLQVENIMRKVGEALGQSNGGDAESNH